MPQNFMVSSLTSRRLLNTVPPVAPAERAALMTSSLKPWSTTVKIIT